jgi:hypothetical protein
MSMLIKIKYDMEKRVYKIPVGNISDDKIEEYIKDITNRLKKPLVNPLTGEIDLKDIDMSNMSQDIWIPSPNYNEEPEN